MQWGLMGCVLKGVGVWGRGGGALFDPGAEVLSPAVPRPAEPAPALSLGAAEVPLSETAIRAGPREWRGSLNSRNSTADFEEKNISPLRALPASSEGWGLFFNPRRARNERDAFLLRGLDDDIHNVNVRPAWQSHARSFKALMLVFIPGLSGAGFLLTSGFGERDRGKEKERESV